jgi:hypothetical protein
MPVFDKNAAFIWAIILLGLAVPALLGVYSHVRLGLARRRLARLRATETETEE